MKLGGTQSIVRKILEGIRDILKMLILIKIYPKSGKQRRGKKDNYFTVRLSKDKKKTKRKKIRDKDIMRNAYFSFRLV